MAEFEEGDRVVYRPSRQWMGDDSSQDEHGTVVLPAGRSKSLGGGSIVTAGPNFVFVKYDGRGPSAQATRAEDLELEEPRACPDCGHSDGPYPNFDRPYSGPLPSGCPTCGWCF
jgi:hypothetical protein